MTTVDASILLFRRVIGMLSAPNSKFQGESDTRLGVYFTYSSWKETIESFFSKHFQSISQTSLRAGVKQTTQDATSNDSQTSLLAKMDRSVF